MNGKFIIKLYSTAPIATPTTVLAIARLLDEIVGENALAGEYMRECDERPHHFEALAQLGKSGLPEWEGQLTIAFGNIHADITGGFEFLRLPSHPKDKLAGKAAQYRSHVFTLELEHGLRNSLAEKGQLFTLMSKLATILDPALGISFGDDEPLREMHSYRGLEAGLPGIYRLMILGTPFIELLGLEQLLSLQVYRSELIDSRWFVMQVDADLTTFHSVAVEDARRQVREQLGPGFFNNPSQDGLDLPSGQIGLIAWLLAVWKSKKDYEAEHRLAQHRPTIDWSGVLRK